MTEAPRQTPPADPCRLEARLRTVLDELGIGTECHRHPPLRTVAESQALRGELPGGHVKNLFLRDKKRAMWLVTVAEDRAVDLKSLRRVLGAGGNLSFGSAELMADVLGVRPGAVTPFAVMNDEAGAVRFVVDAGLMQFEVIHAHPLHNEATIAIARDDLLRFAEHCGHRPLLVNFAADGYRIVG